MILRIEMLLRNAHHILNLQEKKNATMGLMTLEKKVSLVHNRWLPS